MLFTTLLNLLYLGRAEDDIDLDHGTLVCYSVR